MAETDSRTLVECHACHWRFVADDMAVIWSDGTGSCATCHEALIAQTVELGFVRPEREPTVDDDFTDAELGAAYRVIMAELHAAHTLKTGELVAARCEVIISNDDRAAKVHEAERDIGRVSDNLIALGMVTERVRSAHMVTPV
jgi:hypothetical protein